MELDYGREPEFLDPNFQKTVLPVRAYAAMMAERPTDALVYFRMLLEEHAPSPGMRAFALYNSAIALSQADALAQSAEVFRNFRESFSGSNEAQLALLQEADLLAEIGELATAGRLLDDFYKSDAPESLRMQGRLRALQLASDSGKSERVNNLLFQTDWKVENMPDIAVLSFAAVEAGDLLLENRFHNEAIRAYRLALPRDVLIERQRERLITTKHAFSQQAAFASSIWKSYSAQLIARLESQLKQLESMPDYTPGLYLRKGQAYLLGERYREASILFKTIAQSENYDPGLRAEAHYRWILAMVEAEKWDAARKTADLFIQSHPNHGLASSALFLVARAYQGEGRFPEAIEVLDDLITDYPDDPQAPRWYFTKGYNYSVLEQHQEARAHFEEGAERFPRSELRTQLKMWAALTHFFERNYGTAFAQLESLSQGNGKHPLYPEIRYRMANVLYAMREHQRALKVVEDLMGSFPEHHRYAEALAMKGDIYMGLGELTTAAHAFRQVPADDARLYDYAVFQATKIYRALERYDLMREHLDAYIAREDANKRPRVSEALYWIGWSYQQEDRAEKSFPLFDEALARFGNDPEARAVHSILSAYSDLFRREGKATDFDIWLQKTTEQSLSTGKLTWFARLTQFSAQRHRHEKNHARADATLLSIHRLVPLEQQDPSTLASVGLVLANRAYETADEYFERILNEYPKRPQRAAAFYGKALLASQKDRLDESRRWLVRFLEETPTHPLAGDTRLLAAEVLRRQGLYEAAAEGLKEILQLKEMRGRPHARALAGLARIEMDRENPKRAIPYWQRIYTLYRAYPDLLAEAYWESALLFEQIDDPVAAHNTVREMLRDARLRGFKEYELAEARLPALESAARERSALAEQSRANAEEEEARQ
ncbi:MAG TPA: tetratricopeptide repeat protein [Opitutales bacterium]|nr:tetratricopeptide repeat protein [Opitutales bacterium]